MTLIELMMALSIVAIISLAIAGLTFAVSDAQATTDDQNNSLQAARSSLGNLERMIRQARLVSGGGTDHLALWMGDTNGNGQINADETIYLTYLPGQRAVRMKSVRFPVNMDPVYKSLLNDDVSLSQSADVATLDSLVGCTAYIQQSDVAVDVDYMEFKFSAAPPLTQAVTIAARFGTAPRAVSLNSTIHLRAAATKNVVDDGGEFVLCVPACEVTHGG
jgi:type II secretory pathway pseudopilin PulG